MSMISRIQKKNWVRQHLIFSTKTEPDIVLIELRQGLVSSLQEGEKNEAQLFSLFVHVVYFFWPPGGFFCVFFFSVLSQVATGIKVN